MGPSDFAFIQTAPNRVFIGWGPFEQSPLRRPDRPAFFISDFFLDDPHPWRHPASWEETTFDDLASRFGEEVRAPRITWEPPSLEAWADLFNGAREAFARGDFKKVVPVIFKLGRLEERTPMWPWYFSRLARLPQGLTAYGYSYQSHGLAGATPELLFASDPRGYRTMALAGTRPIARAGELLHDAKELREHRLVVDDIVRRLAPFGNIEIEPLRVLELPTLAHLYTPIRFEETRGSELMSFAEMVRRLHPTAALGVSPRTPAGERWLREADRGVKRRTYGAPFGVEREDGRALALVAIRNVQWHHDDVRVGAGAGLLPESRLEREFDELRVKRDQVKALFGLDRGGEAAAVVGGGEKSGGRAAPLAMTNVERAHEVIAEVRARGVRDFCVCAGSRNSPLLAALSTIHDLHLYSFVDERAAAYFALGRAKRDGLPVAVVTTSGTAVAELLPAAIEAHYSGVPLVLITADRPARFRGTGAPQAIEQQGIFGVYATKSVTHINIEFDEPLLDEVAGLRGYEVADGVAGLRGYEVAGGTNRVAGLRGNEVAREANRALAATPQPRNPATQRLNPAAQRLNPAAQRLSTLATPQPRNLATTPQLQFRKPLVLLGGLQAEERDAVLKFVTAYGAAVYAEPLSGLREERALASQVVLNERMLSRGGFDGVIRIGDVPTLRFWRDLDEKYPGVPVVHFSRMPFAGLARGEVHSVEDLPPTPPAVKRDDDYIARDRTRAEEVAAILDREPQSEQGLVRALSRELPVSSRIFLGNSLPVREWDLAATREPRGFAIEANRGANGIDGQLSTFFGWCKPRVENVCIVGDLTALYDLNAPWACPQLNRGVRFRIIIINNGGGRIFSRVASLQPLDRAFRERVIENEHTLRFDDWAAMWKIDYEWGGVVTPMSSEAGMRLVTELVPDPDATKRAWDAYDELWR